MKDFFPALFQRVCMYGLEARVTYIALPTDGGSVVYQVWGEGSMCVSRETDTVYGNNEIELENGKTYVQDETRRIKEKEIIIIKYVRRIKIEEEQGVE